MKAEPFALGAGPTARWLAAAAVSLIVASCGPRAPQAEAPPEEPADTTPAAPPDTVAPVEPDTVPAVEPVDTVPRLVRICAGGDLLIGNNLDTLWAGRASARVGFYAEPFPDPDISLEPLKPLVNDADIVLFNIEGAIGEGPAPSKCRPGSTRCYAFRQPIAVAGSLGRFASHARLVGNVANNHAMDAGVEGFAATIRHLAQAGVPVTGVDTMATAVAADGDSVGFLGFSPFRAGPDPRDLDAVRRHVARAAARYPRLVVTMHMGGEGRGAQRTPNDDELFLGEKRGNSIAFAHAAVEAGASLVIGHGPHVLRAAEWAGDALIFYSLGNLLTYGPFNMREPLNIGAIACAALDEDGAVVEASLRSTMQEPPGVVSDDPNARAAALVDSLSRLDFPETRARVLADGSVVKKN